MICFKGGFMWLLNLVIKILKTKNVEKLVLYGVDQLYNRGDSPVEKKEKDFISNKVLGNGKRK